MEYVSKYYRHSGYVTTQSKTRASTGSPPLPFRAFQLLFSLNESSWPGKKKQVPYEVPAQKFSLGFACRVKGISIYIYIYIYTILGTPRERTFIPSEKIQKMIFISIDISKKYSKKNLLLFPAKCGRPRKTNASPSRYTWPHPVEASHHTRRSARHPRCPKVFGGSQAVLLPHPA